MSNHWKFRTSAVEGRVGDGMLKIVQGVTGATKTEEGKDCPLGNHSVQLYQEDTDSSREKRSNQMTAHGGYNSSVTGHFRRGQWPALSNAVDIING